MLDYLPAAVVELVGELLRELWRVFKTGMGRGKGHDGDILKLR
jgi:hypothetical protein